MGLEVNDKLEVTESDWFNKTQQLFWRGSPMVEVRNVSPSTILQLRFAIKFDKMAMQDLLRASQDQPWSDVQRLDWGKVGQDEAERLKNNGDLKSPAEHCKYAFLAHVEGWAYSGRLK